MINKCPCCGKQPVQAGLISCQNIKCLDYDEKYFVWEWQALVKPGEGEVLIEASC
tara:strand:- start:2832 stop:2996 length:165 start_codon:yes stop_codon:yes gene_type:complete